MCSWSVSEGSAEDNHVAQRLIDAADAASLPLFAGWRARNPAPQTIPSGRPCSASTYCENTGVPAIWRRCACTD